MNSKLWFVAIFVVGFVSAFTAVWVQQKYAREEMAKAISQFPSSSDSSTQDFRQQLDQIQTRLAALEEKSAANSQLENRILELESKKLARIPTETSALKADSMGVSSEKLQGEMKNLIESGEMEQLVRDFEERKKEKQKRYWQTQTPSLPQDIATEVDGKLPEAENLVQQAFSEAGNSREEFLNKLNSKLGAVAFEKNVQVTVLSPKGEFLYHVQGLKGQMQGHQDVNGNDLAETIINNKAGQGTMEYFDFLHNDMARQNRTQYKYIPGPNVWVVIDGHEWKKMP